MTTPASSVGMARGLLGKSPRVGDSQPLISDTDYVRKGAYFQSLTGCAVTRMGNGDTFYLVDTASTTVTLPDVADEVGRHHIVKYVASSGSCNIVAAAGLLDGSATHSIAAQYGVRAYFSDGTAWRGILAPVGAPVDYPWTAYTPTIASNVGVITSYTSDGRYVQLGRLVHFKATTTITNAGTGAGGLNISLPVTPTANTVRQTGAGYEAALTGFILSVNILTAVNAALVVEYDGTTCIATNAVITISGTYEV